MHTCQKCTQKFKYTDRFDNQKRYLENVWSNLHLIKKENEAQLSYVICPGSQGYLKEGLKLGILKFGHFSIIRVSFKKTELG